MQLRPALAAIVCIALCSRPASATCDDCCMSGNCSTAYIGNPGICCNQGSTTIGGLSYCCPSIAFCVLSTSGPSTYFCSTTPPPPQVSSPDLIQSWNGTLVDFAFPTPEDREFYLQQELYKECSLNGLKVSPTGDLYVSIRRYGRCPVTMARLRRKPWSPASKSSSPAYPSFPEPPVSDSFIFEPYPSWELNGGPQKAGGSLTPWQLNASLFQSVLGIEVDPCNRLWVLDQGFSNNDTIIPGGAKLMVFDLSTNELLRTHVFPPDVVLPETFLDDLTVDLVSNMVYISDPGIFLGIPFLQTTYAALIVYDIVADKSWRVLNQDPTVSAQAGFVTIAAGQVLGSIANPAHVGLNGIGLSSDARTLYMTALSSRQLYSIPTAALKNSQGQSTAAMHQLVKLELDDTGGISDGLSCGSDMMLYMTDLYQNGFKRYNPATGEIQLIAQNSSLLQWPDGLGFDNNGSVISFSNQLQNVINGKPVTFQGIWRQYIGQDVGSYMKPWGPLCPSSNSILKPPAAGTTAPSAAPADDDTKKHLTLWAGIATGVATLLLIALVYVGCCRSAPKRRDDDEFGNGYVSMNH